MIKLKTDKKEIASIRESADILSKAHGEMAKAIKAGITTKELDQIAEEYIRSAGAQPAFKGYRGFPSTICSSVNHQVVHCVPDDKVLKDGDIVAIDCGVYHKGFYSDSAFTYAIGNVGKELVNLLAAVKSALFEGIAAAKLGNRIGDIGYAIMQEINKHGCGVVKTFSGHGIGRALHEDPNIPNYGVKGRGPKIKEGMVFAIEPIANLGKGATVEKSDWCVESKDGSPSAHFELMVGIIDGKTEVLTTFKHIEEQIGHE